MLSNEKFQEFLGFLERAKKSETILSQRLATLANQHEINTSEWQALLDHVSEIQAYLSALMSYRRPSLQMDQHALHHLFSSDVMSTESSAPTTQVSNASMLAAVARNVADGMPNQSLGEASSLFQPDLSVPHQATNPPMQNPNVMDTSSHRFGEPTMYRHDDEAEFYHQYPQTNNVRSNVNLEYADDTIDEAYQYGRPDYIDPPVAQVPYRVEQSCEDHQEQWTTEHYDGVQVMRDNYGESETEPNYEYRESFRGQGYESYASVSAGHPRRTPRKQSRHSPPKNHGPQGPPNHPNRRQSRKRRDNGRIPQWLFFGRVNPKCTVKDFLGALNRHGFRVINTIRVHKGDKWNYVPKVKLETPQQMNEALRMRITIFNTSVNVKPYIENEEASGGYPSDSRRPHSARSMQRKKRNRLVKRNTSRRSSPHTQSGSGTVTPNQRIPGKMGRENENILDQDGEISPNCDRNSRESDEVDVSSGIREKILELNINHGNTPSGLVENARFSNNLSRPEHDVTASAGEVG